MIWAAFTNLLILLVRGWSFDLYLRDFCGIVNEAAYDQIVDYDLKHKQHENYNKEGRVVPSPEKSLQYKGNLLEKGYLYILCPAFNKGRVSLKDAWDSKHPDGKSEM